MKHQNPFPPPYYKKSQGLSINTVVISVIVVIVLILIVAVFSLGVLNFEKDLDKQGESCVAPNYLPDKIKGCNKDRNTPECGNGRETNCYERKLGNYKSGGDKISECCIKVPSRNTLTQSKQCSICEQMQEQTSKTQCKSTHSCP